MIFMFINMCLKDSPRLIWIWRSTLSKIKITTGRLYFVCTCLYRSLFPCTSNKKWKIKKWPARNFKIFKFHLCHSKENRLYLSYFHLYLEGFEDIAISKFRKCAKRGSWSFLKISKWDQRLSKENCLYPFVPFVCISKGSEIQWFQNFINASRGEVDHF